MCIRDSGTRIPRGESNLVYRSAKGLFEKVGKQIPPLKITQTNPIPMARGLGSSSACIIAGLLGANRMPVSYTHLDVYKRQTQCGRPWKSWPGKRRHIASGKAECKMYVW